MFQKKKKKTFVGFVSVIFHAALKFLGDRKHEVTTVILLLASNEAEMKVFMVTFLTMPKVHFLELYLENNCISNSFKQTLPGLTKNSLCVTEFDQGEHIVLKHINSHFLYSTICLEVVIVSFICDQID